MSRHNMFCMIRLREELEALGYHDKDTLFGAPYDLRRAPPTSGQPSQVYSDYYARVKDLVHHASEKNGNKPVILIGHSFGSRVILDFLNSTSLSWRQKLIKHMIVISPTPSTGFTQVVTNLASGPADVIAVPAVPSLALRQMWRAFESSLLSLPSPAVFGHKPLVITKNRNYSAYDYPHFLAALGFSTDEVVPFTKRVLPTMLRVDAPMVPTTYLNGAGVQTMEHVMYWEGNFDVAPVIVHGDRDGCINLVSVLSFAKELHRQQRQNNIHFKFVKIDHATHYDIASREHSLRIIMNEVLEANCSRVKDVAIPKEAGAPELLSRAEQASWKAFLRGKGALDG
ncbi:lecithin-cholesterol acyltransferase-like 1 [Triticum aestivum]|uniref:lecithin-cholesterol acyltransferase-like 1 n=1 Tax=Triticum aestivum TaxID=4565 RepID=UPI001D0326D5|nr:lecithin-cholesterol acyltransferase-like 1 [Triticum aestivum]